MPDTLNFKVVPVPPGAHLFECPICFAMVAQPNEHHRWHTEADQLGIAGAEFRSRHPNYPLD